MNEGYFRVELVGELQNLIQVMREVQQSLSTIASVMVSNAKKPTNGDDIPEQIPEPSFCVASEDLGPFDKKRAREATGIEDCVEDIEDDGVGVGDVAFVNTKKKKLEIVVDEPLSIEVDDD